MAVPIERSRSLDNPMWVATFSREMTETMARSGVECLHITVVNDGTEIDFAEVVMGSGNAPSSLMLN